MAKSNKSRYAILCMLRLISNSFGDAVPPSINRKHIEAYQAILKEKKKIFSEVWGKLQQEHKHEPGLPYWQITLDYGIRQVEATLEWCENTLTLLNKKKNCT